MNYIDPRFDSVCKTWPQSDSGDEQPYVAPSIDWNAVFAIPEEKIEVVDLGLEVKAETEEEKERLWRLVREVSRG